MDFASPMMDKLRGEERKQDESDLAEETRGVDPYGWLAVRPTEFHRAEKKDTKWCCTNINQANPERVLLTWGSWDEVRSRLST